MIKLKGYISSRVFVGERVPQNIQNLCLRDFCTKNNFHFALSATEHAMEDSFIVLKKLSLNLGKLDGIEEQKIDANLMYEKGLIRSPFKPIKVLGSGDLKQSVYIVATEFSKSAKEKIEKSGGTAQVL